jgi:hypothetical protein
MGTTMDDFLAALTFWDQRHPIAARFPNKYDKAYRALFATQWFIENVTDDNPDRNDIFFRVRELVREAS